MIVARTALLTGVLALAAGMTPAVRAQTSTSELWPEVDVYWQPAVHQRTMLELSASTEQEGPKREATVGLYQDYLRLPDGYFRGGFRYTFSTRDASYRESRVVGEATFAAYSPPFARFVSRSRIELRYVNGAYSYRLRERIHVQRWSLAPKGPWWAPYGTVEAYYDSRYNTIARLGGRVGTELRVRGPISSDVYVARQSNSRGEPHNVNALGLTLRLNY
ncbi:MAG TPA: hypothetical protein VN706_04110 [Gemmatimonadaceae bacterium]|nr:hypothetical protein [Gemmatimonadaceae bacterium]